MEYGALLVRQTGDGFLQLKLRFVSIEIFVGRQLADDGRRGIVQSDRVFFPL